MDMTNSFFQTLMKPDDMWKTAVTTHFRLYEWIVMPMGLHNSPPIHQCCVTAALQHLIGTICHVYIDDIVIWLNSVQDHIRYMQLVLQALHDASLYLNPKKCWFYQTELDFLGHHISAWGIEANCSKVEKLLNWPIQKSATDVHTFLVLVQYISVYWHTKIGGIHMCADTVDNKGHQNQFPRLDRGTSECLSKDQNSHYLLGMPDCYQSCESW